jgi:hypothetical protein
MDRLLTEEEIHHIQAKTSRGEIDGEYIGDEPDCDACGLQLVEAQDLKTASIKDSEIASLVEENKMLKDYIKQLELLVY